MSSPDTDRFHALHARLNELEAAPVRDVKAIDEVIEALAQEQRRLKTEDGQHGNNPIEHQRPII